MRFSRDWLGDFIDLRDLSDEELGRRLTGIGHAIESVEVHGHDTLFDLEVTTNRVDAMSHRGMARELSAALGRPLTPALAPHAGRSSSKGEGSVQIRIDVPEMCRRYTGLV